MKPIEWMIRTQTLYDRANIVTVRGVDNFIKTMEYHIDWWRKEKEKEYGDTKLQGNN